MGAVTVSINTLSYGDRPFVQVWPQKKYEEHLLENQHGYIWLKKTTALHFVCMFIIVNALGWGHKLLVICVFYFVLSTSFVFWVHQINGLAFLERSWEINFKWTVLCWMIRTWHDGGAWCQWVVLGVGETLAWPNWKHWSTQTPTRLFWIYLHCFFIFGKIKTVRGHHIEEVVS